MLTVGVRVGMLRMLGTGELGPWPGLASLLWLNLHWHFLAVVGMHLCSATHTLSMYLGGISEIPVWGSSYEISWAMEKWILQDALLGK